MTNKKIKQLYEIANICYLRILPSMFKFDGDISSEIYVNKFIENKYIRKYWKSGKLICQSQNFITGKNKQKCQNCEHFTPSNIYKSPCQIRLQLYWKDKEGKKYCLELANTGIKNYLKLERDLEKVYKNEAMEIKIYVIPKKTESNREWGEVRFEACY